MSIGLTQPGRERRMGGEFIVMVTNMTGCAYGMNDITWGMVVTADSEDEAREVGLESARDVNRDTGLPPHGIRVSEERLRELAVVVRRGPGRAGR